MSSEGLQWYEYVNHDIKEQELEGGYLWNLKLYLSKTDSLKLFDFYTKHTHTHTHIKYINRYIKGILRYLRQVLD